MNRPNRQMPVAAGSNHLSIPLHNLRPSPPRFGSSRDRLLDANRSRESIPESDITESDTAGPSSSRSGNTTPLTEPEDNAIPGALARDGARRRRRRSEIETRLTPILPPPGYATLDWRPNTLKTWVLIVMAVCCFIIAVATFLLWRLAGQDSQIELSSENVHILSTYLPAVVATISGLLFRATFVDFCRVMVFYAMADGKKSLGTGALARDSVGGTFYPFPSLLIFRRTTLAWMFNLLHTSLSLTMFLTAAKVILLTSKPKQDSFGWTLIVNASAARYIIVSYILTGIMYFMILYFVCHHQTGLKWDPATIQDLLTLFSETRSTTFFEQLLSSKELAYEKLSKTTKWRIGYWWKVRIDAEGRMTEGIVVYGIAPVHRSGRPTVISEKIQPPTTPRAILQTPCGCRRYPRCQHGPRRYCVRSRWYALFRQIFHLCFYLAGIGACIAAFGTGIFINGFKIRDTWKEPHIHFTWWIIGGQAMTDTNLPYALVFRFLPTQVAFWTVAHIRFLDTSIRASQPYRSMAQDASLGSSCIGLEYQIMLAFQIPIVALEKSHYRVAWFSTINAISSLCPAFVSGLFVIQKQDGYVNFDIAKISFFAVLFYCVIFTITIIWAWTREFDRLPRFMYSIADQMTLCRGAKILEEKCLDIADPKITREKFQAKMILLDNKYRIGFYRGTCGHDHFGFDVVETSTERPDPQDATCNLVTAATRPPRSGINAASLTQRLGWRRQHQVVNAEEGDEQV